MRRNLGFLSWLERYDALVADDTRDTCTLYLKVDYKMDIAICMDEVPIELYEIIRAQIDMLCMMRYVWYIQPVIFVSPTL
jgi:hypothetical protein